MGVLRLTAPLITSRLTLRELVADDAAFVLELMNDPGFIEFIGDRGVRTLEDARRYVDHGPWTRYATTGFGLWLVSLRDTGESIGICGLLQRDVLPQPDIGFAFLARFQSLGYAREAAEGVVAFGREQMGLPRVLAVVNPSNARSIRLLERMGFTFERTGRLSRDAAEVALYAIAFDTMPPP